MLESFPFALFIGTALGFLSALGVGGGSLLILWLTLIINMEHQSARIINLLFFIPSAIIASIFRWKQGTLNIRYISSAIIAGCISAGIFAQLGKLLDTTLLKRLFGGILLLTGLRELFYRPRNAK